MSEHTMGGRLPGVVVGVDGAADGLRAARWAAREAGRRVVGLTVVYAREHFAAFRDDYDINEGQRAFLASESDRIVAEAVAAAREAAPGVTVDGKHADGDATEVLLDIAGIASLLVVGSRGRGGFASLLLGSVSDRVAQRAPCPVVVVREVGDSAGPVIVGLDPEHEPSTVLEFAFESAAAGSGSLTVVHTLTAAIAAPPPPGFIPPTGAIDVLMPADRLRLGEVEISDLIAPWISKFPTVTVSTSVAAGSAAGHLVEASREASLLVVGTRGHSRVGGLLGSVSTPVLHHAQCPVAIARP